MKISLLLALAWYSFPWGCYAQEQMSLSDAIQIGLSNNFGIRIEQENLEIARNNNNWGEAGRFPTIEISVAQNNGITDINNPASFLQGQLRSNDLNPMITARWSIFDGFRVNINKNRLELLEAESDGNAQIVIENAIQAIVEAYYTVLLEQERLQVLQQVLTLSSDRYQHVLIRKNLGSAVTFDIVQDKDAYLTDSSNFVLQELVYENAIET